MSEELVGIAIGLVVAALGVVGWFARGRSRTAAPSAPPAYVREAVKEHEQVHKLEHTADEEREALAAIGEISDPDARTNALAEAGNRRRSR